MAMGQVVARYLRSRVFDVAEIVAVRRQKSCMWGEQLSTHTSEGVGESQRPAENNDGHSAGQGQDAMWLAPARS